VQEKSGIYNAQSTIYDNEYLEAQRYKEKLLNDYRNKRVDEVYNGIEIENKSGKCFCTSDAREIKINKLPQNNFTNSIQNNLKLIYGIGEITERRLKDSGYKSLIDLKKHPRFSNDACQLSSIIDSKNYNELNLLIKRRLSKSHPSVFQLSSARNIEDFVFLDIETLGLFNRPIILIGAARIKNDYIFINQYFVRDISEEQAAISNLLSELNENSILVTYNGDAFDIPFIEERMFYYGIGKSIECPGFDLLLFSRRAWRERLPNCKLVTIEKQLLGIDRGNDVPSALVPEFYETYLRTGNIGPVIPIINHNKEDIFTLANIYFKLCEVWSDYGCY